MSSLLAPYYLKFFVILWKKILGEKFSSYFFLYIFAKPQGFVENFNDLRENERIKMEIIYFSSMYSNFFQNVVAEFFVLW